MTDHVCLNQARIEALESENSKLKEAHDSTRESVIEIKADMKYIKETLNSLKTIVEKMADEPRKKWEQLQRQVLSFVVGGSLIGFVVWAVNMANNYK